MLHMFDDGALGVFLLANYTGLSKLTIFVVFSAPTRKNFAPPGITDTDSNAVADRISAHITVFS